MGKEKNILGELLKRCGQGEEQAQYQLYNMYSKGMFNVSLRILGQREDAEDVVQEAFIKMFNKLDSLKEPAAFTGWFKRIVVNNSINYVKKRNKIYFEEAGENIKDVVDEKETDQKESFTVDGIKQALAQLAPGYRIVVSLFLFDGFSHKQIADTLGITESTSKSQYHRGRKKLQELLKQAS